MTCPKCGNEMPDNATQCAICGEPIQAAQSMPEEQPVPASPSAESDAALVPGDLPNVPNEEKTTFIAIIKQQIQKLMQNKKRLFVVAGSLLVIVLLVVLIVGKTNTAENTVKKYLYAVHTMNFEKALDYEIIDYKSVKAYIMTDEHLEAANKKLFTPDDTIDSVDEFFKKTKDDEKYYDKQGKYGDNITVSILASHELSENQREEFLSKMDSFYHYLFSYNLYTKSGKIGTVKQINYCVQTDKGEYRPYSNSDSLFMVKLNGSWVVVPLYLSDSVLELIVY